ncbi:hypothetical protein ETD86_51620 [Nonomuraea turkmeniaca]|uniref:Uncharacterized protein n=1 Tax=Nonomuraea turkmeniaca TaxID=103838 RepID=A0A5S4EVL7_9ACTN|nr:hypothetical protein [Nonomuraea turkmeniaca]TMR07409.1 hypothetical protein ETD86_51620 [Nonomuraea turkmeniaca]
MLRRLGALVVAAVFVTACSAHEEPVLYRADYPQYQSADALFDKATLVVEARIVGAPRYLREVAAPDPAVTDPKLNPQAGAPAAAAAQPEAPPTVITVYTAQVTKVFKGQAQPGQSIEVKELGGVFEGVTYQEEHTTPLNQDGGYVLFLETYPDSPAALLNPVQAKYPLDAASNPAPLPENPIKLTRAELETMS